MTQTKAELLQTRHQGDIRLNDADSTNYVGFKAPATISSNLVWTLPAADGSANQFLKTNASGVLSWGTVDTSTLMPLGGGTFTGDVTFTGAAANVVWDKSDNALEFADNSRAKFGTGGDLSVYHDGSNSWISNGTTGQDLYVQSKRDLYFKVGDGSGGNHTCIYADNNGGVQLKHDNTTRIATNSTGIAVTGAATISTDLTVTGDLTVSGTTTTINTATLDVEDKNVVLGKVSSPSDTTADGGGWTLKGASDKTFNWVNATDAWTSSEHIHLGDSKKLFLGDGSDLQIWHNGTNGVVRNTTTTGNLHFQNQVGDIILEAENNTLFKNWDGQTYARFMEDGACELYYDDAKKLETTTGGINVTGVINVNGSALASGNTVDLVADGAIAAGKPVIIKSNGKAEQVKTIVNPKTSSFTAVSSEITLGGNLAGLSNARETHTIYFTYSSSEWFACWAKTSSGESAYLHLYKKQSGTWTYKSETSTNGIDNSANDKNRMSITWDSTNNRIICAYTAGGSNETFRYRVAEITNASTGAVSLGSEGEIVGGHNNNNSPKIDFDPTTGRLMFGYVGWSGDPYLKIGSVDTSDNSIDWGSATTVSGAGADAKRLGITSIGSSKGVMTFSKNNTIYAALFTISNSANSATVQTPITYTDSGNSPEYPVIEWNPDESKVAIMYRDNGDSGKLKLIQSAVSGTTLGTFSTNVVVHSTGNTHNQYWLGWNSYSSGMYAIFIEDENYGNARMSNINMSSTNPTSTPNNGSTTSGYGEFIVNIRPADTNTKYQRFATAGMDQANGELLFGGHNVGTGTSHNGIRVERIGTAINSTNATASNVIGFAEDAINDTATGTIKLTGNVVGNQSSLTAGTAYYIQANGTLGTSQDNTIGAASGKSKAGVALSATTLKIADYA